MVCFYIYPNDDRSLDNDLTSTWEMITTSTVPWHRLPELSTPDNSAICMLKSFDYLTNDLPFDFDDISFKSYRNSMALFLKNECISY